MALQNGTSLGIRKKHIRIRIKNHWVEGVTETYIGMGVIENGKNGRLYICTSLLHLCPTTLQAIQIQNSTSFSFRAIVLVSGWGSLGNVLHHTMITSMPLPIAMQLFLDFPACFYQENIRDMIRIFSFRTFIIHGPRTGSKTGSELSFFQNCCMFKSFITKSNTLLLHEFKKIRQNLLWK